MIGETLGSYRVVAKIGEGGMGAVYLGEHPLIGRKAAIKVLRPEYSHHRDAVDRFFREAKLTASLRHPALVDVFDFGLRPDGSAYLIMDYLEGQSLEERLARAEPSIQISLEIVRQIAIGLGVAHAAGIVHRDLKPGNVFLTPDPAKRNSEIVKILDFGVAKLTSGDGSAEVTRTDILLGTPLYMAPEQCRGSQVDYRADIYAAGCVLYRLTCGRPPFNHRFQGELIAAHMYQTPEAPRSINPAVPPEVERIMLKALAKDPNQRHQSTEELASELERCLHAELAQRPTRSSAPPGVALPSRQVQPSDARAALTPSASAETRWSAHPAAANPTPAETPIPASTMLAPSRSFEGREFTEMSPQGRAAAPAPDLPAVRKDPGSSTLSRGAASVPSRPPRKPAARRGAYALVALTAVGTASFTGWMLIRKSSGERTQVVVAEPSLPTAVEHPPVAPVEPAAAETATPRGAEPYVGVAEHTPRATASGAREPSSAVEATAPAVEGAEPNVPAPAPAPRAAQAAAAPGAAAAYAPALAAIRVDVSNGRPGLTVKVDGRDAALPLRLPKDMRTHEISFETPNFHPEKHTIRADRNQTLTLDNKPHHYIP